MNVPHGLRMAKHFVDGRARLPAPPPSRHDRVLRPLAGWAVHLTRALEPRIPPGRRGLYVGYGGLRPAWDEMFAGTVNQAGSPWRDGLRKLHPFFMLRNLSNNAHGIIASELNITADGATYGGEDAGLEALAGASDALSLGIIDVALVVVYDSRVQPEIAVAHPDRALGEAVVALALTEPTSIPAVPRGPYGCVEPILNALGHGTVHP